MKRQTVWLNKHTQQAVSSKVANLAVYARTGPNAPPQIPKKANSAERPSAFIVGVSKVGEGDTIQ